MTKPNTLFKEAYNASLAMLEAAATLPSEAELGQQLNISRTTVRMVLRTLADSGLIDWNGQAKTVLRRPAPEDFFPSSETDSISDLVERSFMQRILSSDMKPGDRISEIDLAREIGVSTSTVREFLIRFSRYGLIEKQRNRHWTLKGFTQDFALELFEVREMFELRSARAFVRLPAEHPAWPALDAIASEHRAMLADIDRGYRAFSPLDERFHRLIHASSRNRFIIEFYDVIALVFHHHYQWNKTDEKARNRTALEEHLAYIEALQRRSELDTEYYCRKHLLSARTTLLQSVAK